MSSRNLTTGRLAASLTLAAAIAWSATPGAGQEQEAAAVQSRVERSSYALGVNLAQSFSRDGLVIDLPALYAGIEDALAGRDLKLDLPQLREALNQLRADAEAHRQEQQQAQAARNREEGPKYLAANREKEGVVETASGLQYLILEPGDGPKPSASDRVRVHYRGTTIDGTVFDSSYARGEPAVFAVNQVVAGWTEALQLMSVGAKWQLALPPSLAYGSSPPPGASFGPDAVLLFEVELIAIE